jgi:hypothetical protein
VKSNGILCEKIEVKRRVIQGDSLNSLLFSLVMNKIIKDVRYKEGYKIGDKELNVTCYADDAVLIADSENSLQRLLHQFRLSCQTYHV